MSKAPFGFVIDSETEDYLAPADRADMLKSMQSPTGHFTKGGRRVYVRNSSSKLGLVLVAGGLLAFFMHMRKRRRGLRDDEAAGKKTPIPATMTLDYGTDEKQKLDVYIPPNVKPNAPIFFMIHGGAWLVGSKTADAVVTNKYRYWAEGKGYIFVSVDYRLKVSPLTEVEDVASALAFVQGHAQSWGGDPNKIVVVGHSAGAHLASLVTADAGLAMKKGLNPWLATVALDSAAYDLPKIMTREHEKFYDKVFGTDQQLWIASSPTLVLGTALNAPAFYGFCNTNRDDDGCEQVQTFVNKAAQTGAVAAFGAEDYSHTEMNELLGLPNAYTQKVEKFFQDLGLP